MMTTQEVNQYLVEARNPDGSLVFPQFGGCWHSWLDNNREEGTLLCKKCKVLLFETPDNPDLFTWPSFGILWEAMQSREDFGPQLISNIFIKPQDDAEYRIFSLHVVNPATFPGVVAAYLKGLK